MLETGRHPPHWFVRAHVDVPRDFRVLLFPFRLLTICLAVHTELL